MKPDTVVFDLGKVLLDFDYPAAAHKLEKHSRVSTEELRHMIDQSPLLYRFETGLVSTEEFFAEIQSKSGFHGNLTQFSELFGDIFTPIDPMIELHGKLLERGVPTYLFSNTNALAVRHIRQRYPFFHNFNGYILSFEHGAMKPSAKLYEVVERLSGQQGSAILYIDDRPENIAAGAERGWQTILHERPEQTLGAVQRTGLLDGTSRPNRG